MISIIEQTYGLEISLYNECTIEDFKELETAVLSSVERIHRPDMLFDLRMLKDFTIDMAVEQLKFTRQHRNDFGRIAIVVNDMWIKVGSKLSGLITQLHPKYFKDIDDARKWLSKNAA